MTKREDILNEAKRIVTGDRNKQYGEPEDCFAEIADLWSIYLGKSIDTLDVPMMMVLLKVARLKNAKGTTEPITDNLVDIAGYAACANEIDRVTETTKDCWLDDILNHLERQ